MKPETFVRKLKQFGYTPHNAGELLGIGRRSAYRYAIGQTAIPEIVVKLLEMYELHGAPPPREKRRKD